MGPKNWKNQTSYYKDTIVDEFTTKRFWQKDSYRFFWAQICFYKLHTLMTKVINFNVLGTWFLLAPTQPQQQNQQHVLAVVAALGSLSMTTKTTCGIVVALNQVSIPEFFNNEFLTAV